MTAQTTPAARRYVLARVSRYDLLSHVQPGATVFLAMVDRDVTDGRSRDRRYASPTPFCTNSSREIRLHGWCGTTNNTCTVARGAGVVTAVVDDGAFRSDEEAIVRVRVAAEGSEEEASLLAGWEEAEAAEEAALRRAEFGADAE